MSATTMRRASPYRLVEEARPEVELHEAVAKALDLLLLAPAVWTTLPIGHVKLTGQQADRLARVGVKRGWFDIIVCHGGRSIGVELKRPGAPLSRSRLVPTRKGGRRMVEGQREVFPRLQAAGLQIIVCSSVPDVLAQLRGLGVPIRGHTL
ncbi:MAG TPA: hypothetical protein VGH36_04490 [Acetobacteraceae bacterium]